MWYKTGDTDENYVGLLERKGGRGIRESKEGTEG